MMCERGVRYLMVFPDQRPTEPDDPRLGTVIQYDADRDQQVVQPIFQTGSSYAAEAGGANMMVYELNWPAGCD
jgi:hypothetical protein